MAVTELLIPNEAEAAATPRRRQLLFAAAFAGAAWVMFLVTLLGGYLSTRAVDRVAWLKDNQIPLTQPTVMLATMIMSAITVQWAVYSISRDDRGHTYLALAVTGLFGVAFINQTWFLYTQVAVKVAQKEGAFFYALTGGHLAMVACATIFLVVMLIRSLGGSFSRRYPDGVSALALFWHVTVAMYAVVWFAVYVSK